MHISAKLCSKATM
ncbi:hypothetical protein F383_32039 [Gossypium arboreum]|uniref:Uncharacterized protein n=1 Tax=Gossypium arboreum TaxID=29729 RepID=A0A0B0N522_GOSAR|nr:hypothetical protein F383_32039 [Gossypium arboreum]